MAVSKIEKPLIRTQSSREATCAVTSHDTYGEIAIMSDNPSPSQPSVIFGIASNGYITIYTDVGNGWEYKRTV